MLNSGSKPHDLGDGSLCEGCTDLRNFGGHRKVTAGLFGARATVARSTFGMLAVSAGTLRWPDLMLSILVRLHTLTSWSGLAPPTRRRSISVAQGPESPVGLGPACQCGGGAGRAEGSVSTTELSGGGEVCKDFWHFYLEWRGR